MITPRLPLSKAFRRFAGQAVLCLLAAAPATATAAGELASDWVVVQQARVRLVAGIPPGAKAGSATVAGIEIEMGEGWKTYWRVPGEAGGVPPSFDWTGSSNVTPTVLFPAPHRLVDRAGETIGYKKAVTFPVKLVIADAAQPARLQVKAEFGVCREICIPAEADLGLDLPPAVATAMPAALAAAWSLVPGREAKTGAPSLVSSRATLTGDKPRIAFEVAYPAGAGGADAFAEGPSGVYVPMPRRVSAAGSTVGYEIDLAGVDLADIKGKDLVVTLTSDAAQAEVLLPVK